MVHDEERRKIVVETPVARREVEQRIERTPDRTGISTGALTAIVVGAVALTAIIVLMLMSQTRTDNTNAAVANEATQPTTIVQQPQQPPIVIEQPAQQAPVIVPVPVPGSAGSGDAASRDLEIRTEIERKIQADPTLSSLGITVSVLDGKVTLMGSVVSLDLKSRIERLARDVRSVRGIDNQIVVTG